MTWTPENWQQIGDIANRLAKEKARQRSSATGPDETANEKDSRMSWTENSASEARSQ